MISTKDLALEQREYEQSLLTHAEIEQLKQIEHENSESKD